MCRIRSALAILVVAAAFSFNVQAADEVYKWTDEKGVVQYSDSAPEGRLFEKINVGRSGSRAQELAAAPEAETVAPEPAAPKPPAQSNCDQARKRLDAFEKSAVVTMDRDGDGTPELLDKTQHATELARSKEMVTLFCTE